MLEPPLITGLVKHFFKLAKHTPLIDRLTPAGITQVRAQRWDLDENLFDYFSKKSLFKAFDPDCIQHYIEAAVSTDNMVQTLNFDVQKEADIFRTIPHNLSRHYNTLEVPSTLVSAEFTNVCVPFLRKPFLKRNQGMKHIEFKQGGHMFPMEKPEQLANLIKHIIIEQSE
jgi:pimeloyl-ACP methyl ester carboxylesterase